MAVLWMTRSFILLGKKEMPTTIQILTKPSGSNTKIVHAFIFLFLLSILSDLFALLCFHSHMHMLLFVHISIYIYIYWYGLSTHTLKGE